MSAQVAGAVTAQVWRRWVLLQGSRGSGTRSSITPHTSRAATSTQTSWMGFLPGSLSLSTLNLPWCFTTFQAQSAAGDISLLLCPRCQTGYLFSARWCLFITTCTPPSIQQLLGKGCSECQKARVSSRLESNVLAGCDMLTCIKEISNLMERAFISSVQCVSSDEVASRRCYAINTKCLMVQ